MVEHTDVIATIKYRITNGVGHLGKKHEHHKSDVTKWTLWTKILMGFLR